MLNTLRLRPFRWVLFAGLLLSCGFSAQAQYKRQDAPKLRHSLKVNPLSLLVKTYTAFYELNVGNMHGMQLGFNYTDDVCFLDYCYRGTGITAEYRNYFLQKEEAEGLFFAPYLRFRDNRVTREQEGDDLRAHVNSYGLGVLAGYRLLGGEKNHFSFDVYLGPSYFHTVFKEENLKEQFDLSPAFGSFGLRAGLLLGYSF